MRQYYTIPKSASKHGIYLPLSSNQKRKDENFCLKKKDREKKETYILLSDLIFFLFGTFFIHFMNALLFYPFLCTQHLETHGICHSQYCYESEKKTRNRRCSHGAMCIDNGRLCLSLCVYACEMQIGKMKINQLESLESNRPGKI